MTDETDIAEAAWRDADALAAMVRARIALGQAAGACRRAGWHLATIGLDGMSATVAEIVADIGRERGATPRRMGRQ